MKKLALLLGVMFIALTGCSSNNNIMSKYPGFEKKKDHHFVAPTSYDAFVTALEEKQEGLYYIGFPTCPWCISVTPILEEALSESNKTMYYLDKHSDKMTEALEERLTKWDNALSVDLTSGKEHGPQYVPFIVAIDKNGTITTHTGTVEGHQPSERGLTEDEKLYLVARFKRMFEPVTNMGVK